MPPRARSMGRHSSKLGAIAGLALLALLAACGALKPRAESHLRLIGYVSADKTFPRIDAGKLTALNFAFGRIDANGEVALNQAQDADFLARLVALKARNPKLKILLSVGGWGADGFSDAALTDDSRERFAASAAQLLARHQLDGLDIDWEYPGLPGPGIRHRVEDKRDFTLLLETLRHRFDALARAQGRRADDPYLLTAALADSEFVAQIELDRVHRSLDWVNLMTYDFHGSLGKTTGHHSALTRSATSPADERSVESAVGQFVGAGVPRNKLIVGVPFYAKGFAEVEPANHGLDQPYGRFAGAYPWSQLVADFIDRNGYVRYWDVQAKEPYLWNEQKREFISYDDPESLRLKAQFVKAHDLGGIMYWQQSQDPDAVLIGVLSGELR